MFKLRFPRNPFQQILQQAQRGMSAKRHRYKLLALLPLLLLLCSPSWIMAAEQSPGDTPNIHTISTIMSTTTSIVRPIDDRGGLTVNPQNRQESFDFFKRYYITDTPDHNWNGNTANCLPGETSAAFQAAVALRINYFRAMAGVPADIELLAEYNQKAQQMALMISVNERSSHAPTQDWQCYTADGHTAAERSNLYFDVFGPDAIDGYIRDPGDGNYFVAHRRWILFPQTRLMGSGDVPHATDQHAANTLWVFDDHGDDPRPATREAFVAWPPPGFVPYQVIYPRWSFAYPEADFTNATVTMSQNNRPITTTQATVENGLGDNTLVWRTAVTTSNPRWPQPTVDTPYQVIVSDVLIGGETHTFTYTVTVFDPEVIIGGGMEKKLYLPLILR